MFLSFAGVYRIVLTTERLFAGANKVELIPQHLLRNCLHHLQFCLMGLQLKDTHKRVNRAFHRLNSTLRSTHARVKLTLTPYFTLYKPNDKVYHADGIACHRKLSCWLGSSSVFFVDPVGLIGHKSPFFKCLLSLIISEYGHLLTRAALGSPG